MGLISLLSKDPFLFLVLAVLLLYSIIAHEVAHGWTAGLFGDDTARRAGRLTANPVSHIDPIGAVMLFVVGFGWAKPVPVNYAYLRRSRFALSLVSLAGPLTNFLIAFAAVLLLQAPSVRASFLAVPLSLTVKINIILAAFNLIPLPPLDGSKILAEFLPLRARLAFLSVERMGFFVLIILLYTGVLRPVIAFMENAIYGVIYGILRLFS